MTAHGTGSRGGISANLELAREQVLHAFVALDDHDQVNAFNTDLQAPASACDGEERWSAPSVCGAARCDASAAFSTEDESALYHVRNDGDALGVIEHLVRNAFIGSLHDFVQNRASLL
jgi:hypothetical protein